MRKFAIFYNDGSVVYGGGDDDELIPVYFSRKWLEAPSDGVCHIAMEDPTLGRAVLKENEFYFQMPFDSHGDGYLGASMKLGAYLRQSFQGGTFVKFGGWTSTENYREIARKAQLDSYIPRPSAKPAVNDEEAVD